MEKTLITTEFLFKKTEKLSSALYMVSNFFDKEDPIAKRLKEIAVEILSLKSNSKDIAEIKDKVSETVSLLRVGYLSGFISEMNKNVLERESRKIAENCQTYLDSKFLPQSFFVKKEQPLIKDTVDNIKDSPVSSNRVALDVPTAKPVKKSYRKDIIVDFLKKKESATIKDIALKVKGCSEKTIQRELADLVNSGMLQKKGDRRWTQYSLIN